MFGKSLSLSFLKPHANLNLIYLSNKYLISSDAFWGHDLVVDLAVSALEQDLVMLKVFHKEMILNPQSFLGDGPDHPQPNVF